MTAQQAQGAPSKKPLFAGVRARFSSIATVCTGGVDLSRFDRGIRC